MSYASRKRRMTELEKVYGTLKVDALESISINNQPGSWTAKKSSAIRHTGSVSMTDTYGNIDRIRWAGIIVLKLAEGSRSVDEECQSSKKRIPIKKLKYSYTRSARAGRGREALRHNLHLPKLCKKSKLCQG